MRAEEAIVDSVAEGSVQVPTWLLPLRLPAVIAAAAVTIILGVVVSASKSAWLLLGAGRGVVPEEYYHLSAFLLMLGTAFGQAVGWAGGSAVLYYAITRLGFWAGWRAARIAMTVVYLGLGTLPFAAYHLLYGGWLLGLPRGGLEEWLAANHPDAAWILLGGHTVVDLSLIPLGAVFLGVLWRYGERLLESLSLQTVLALALLGTSLAVALSLGIHSALVHIRL